MATPVDIAFECLWEFDVHGIMTIQQLSDTQFGQFQLSQMTGQFFCLQILESTGSSMGAFVNCNENEEQKGYPSKTL